MKSRMHLVNSGLYPETLPPCFTSKDSQRAFHGIIGDLDKDRYHLRKTEYARYSGTKHDGNRRFFGTPNIVTYFHISTFIWRNWNSFENGFSGSDYSIGAPSTLDESDDRAIKVPSLSELSKHTSTNLKYAPYILRADIAQCFPSLYTHSIPWAVHGIDESKADTDPSSQTNFFNALDFFVRNGQKGNTRGVLVGPDAYRLIAELVLARIDQKIADVVGDKIVGAVRHVDDYYFGLRSEHDAQSVLSNLRETLATYELNLNDQKTQIYSSLEPINDLWAQRLREHTQLSNWQLRYDEVERAISESIHTANEIGSDSPIKILLRSFDEVEIYESSHWAYVEENLQRIVQKHPHSVDYACLLVAKRAALGLQIDREGWLAVAEIIVGRCIALNHDHEVVWMVWLLIVCAIEVPDAMVEEVSKSQNPHIRAMMAQAYVDQKISRKPALGLGSPLSSVDANWLVNLVAKSQGFSKAAFSGLYAPEFNYLANRHISLIDFDSHMDQIKTEATKAISRSRYGYDDDDAEDVDDVYDDFDVF